VQNRFFIDLKCIIPSNVDNIPVSQITVTIKLWVFFSDQSISQ